MIFGEYSYEDDIRVQRQEAFEDGMEKGIAQGLARQKVEDEKLLLAEKERVAQQEAKIQQLQTELAQLRAK